MSAIAFIKTFSVCLHFSRNLLKMINMLIIFLVAVSCSQHQSAPISSRQPPVVSQINHHVVKAGETLYSIAWQYNIDYHQLAIANGIDSDYIIFPGQKLSLSINEFSHAFLTKTPKQTSKSSTSTPALVGSPKTSTLQKAPLSTTKNRSNKASPSRMQKIQKLDHLANFSWQWPAKGRVVTNFYSGGAAGKGIDIAGKKGESILAAANGEIVYAGNGIRGYGNLVIIRHNAQYLSAYAHNHTINVKEGDQVNGGQRIAELGSTGAGANSRTILHFQVRKNGKPIDPLSLLPKRNF